MFSSISTGKAFIIAQALSPLTALFEAQRMQALERFRVILSALEKDIAQAEAAYTLQLSFRMIQRWMKCHREQ